MGEASEMQVTSLPMDLQVTPWGMNVTSDTSDIGQGCLLAAGICQPMTESSLGILMSVMETWIPGTIVYHFQLHLSDLSVDFGQSEWHH